MKNLSAPGKKLIDVIKEALEYRGFTKEEADTMVERLITFGGDSPLDVDIVIPFGKYRGYAIGDVPEDYLGWLLSQTWVREKYGNLYMMIGECLSKRKGQ